MPLVPALLTLIVIAHLLLNCLISIRVARSATYEAFQKYAQFVLIWLLPVIGVIVVALFLQSGERLRVSTEQEIGDDDVEESLFADHGSPHHQVDDQ